MAFDTIRRLASIAGGTPPVDPTPDPGAGWTPTSSAELTATTAALADLGGIILVPQIGGMQVVSGGATVASDADPVGFWANARAVDSGAANSGDGRAEWDATEGAVRFAQGDYSTQGKALFFPGDFTSTTWHLMMCVKSTDNAKDWEQCLLQLPQMRVLDSEAKLSIDDFGAVTHALTVQIINGVIQNYNIKTGFVSAYTLIEVRRDGTRLQVRVNGDPWTEYSTAVWSNHPTASGDPNNWMIGRTNYTDATKPDYVAWSGLFNGLVLAFGRWLDGTDGTEARKVAVQGQTVAGLEPGSIAAPVAGNLTVGTPYETAVSINALGAVTPGTLTVDATSIAIVTAPASGTATTVGQPAGTILFTPAAAFDGARTIGYTIDDAAGSTSNEGTITVNVAAAATVTPPSTSPSTVSTGHNTPITISPSVTAGSNPLDLDSIEITVAPSPSGAATPQSNGTILFTPATGSSGAITFSFRIFDNAATASNASVITVNVAAAGSGPTAEDGTTSYPAATRVVNVSTAAQLSSALSDAVAGDHIVLASGTYSGSFSITKSASASAPIVIRGTSLLQARIVGNSSLTVAGSDVWTWGLQFDGKRNAGGCINVTGTRHKIIGCRFFDIGSSTSWTQNNFIDGQAGRSDFLEIGYCHFDTPASFHSWSSGDPQWPQWRFGMRFHRWADRAPYDLWVHHCRFNDFPAKPSADYRSAQSDAVEIAAVGSDFDTRNKFSHCLFENILDGSGSIIDVKAGRAGIAEYLTTVNCTGRLDLRTADNWTVRHIWMENTQGIDIFGQDHLIEDVRFFGTGAKTIDVCIGNLPAGSSQNTDQRVQARNVVIQGCPEANLRVGTRYSTSPNLYPINTQLLGPRASTSISGSATGTVNSPSASVPASKAFKLSASDVGPTKLATFA